MDGIGIGHDYEFGLIFNITSVIDVVNTQQSSSECVPDVESEISHFEPRKEETQKSDYQTTD